MATIAAFGDVDIDLILDVDDYPRPGDEVFADTARTGLGGSAVNTAVWLVRLGFDALVLAQVGRDAFGLQATAALEQSGVDAGSVTVSESRPTGMNVLFVTPDGERTMIGLRGANRDYRGSPGWATGCDWLHMSGYALLEGEQRRSALGALEEAREGGLPVSVDVPSGVARMLGSELARILSGAAIVSVGRKSLAEIMPGPDPVADLLATGVGTLAVTAGADPFSVCRRGETVTLAPPAVKVVDTTGAGDAFVGGLIAGTLWELDLGPTAALAAALGAAATQVQGPGNERPGHVAPDRLLDIELWPDAEPSWLEKVGQALRGQQTRARSPTGPSGWLGRAPDRPQLSHRRPREGRDPEAPISHPDPRWR